MVGTGRSASSEINNLLQHAADVQNSDAPHQRAALQYFGVGRKKTRSQVPGFFSHVAKHGAGDPKRWLRAGIERTISRYPRTIDFGLSNRQNDNHSERTRIHPPLVTPEQWMWNMSTDLNYATGRFSRAIRFVLVNNRVPRTDQHCALCGCLLEKGYIRDSQTRLIYCDTGCFGGWTHEVAPVIKTRGRKAS